MGQLPFAWIIIIRFYFSFSSVYTHFLIFLSRKVSEQMEQKLCSCFYVFHVIFFCCVFYFNFSFTLLSCYLLLSYLLICMSIFYSVHTAKVQFYLKQICYFRSLSVCVSVCFLSLLKSRDTVRFSVVFIAWKWCFQSHTYICMPKYFHSIFIPVSLPHRHIVHHHRRTFSMIQNKTLT